MNRHPHFMVFSYQVIANWLAIICALYHSQSAILATRTLNCLIIDTQQSSSSSRDSYPVRMKEFHHQVQSTSTLIYWIYGTNMNYYVSYKYLI